MKINRIKSIILTYCIMFYTAINTNAQPCKEVVGYYPNWQWYDRNKLVNPQTIDYSKYSIINYCFFVPESDGSISSHDQWADDNLLLGEMNWSTNTPDFTTSIIYNAHQNQVKVLPSIGGWTLSDNFPSIAADASKRANFAQSCVNLIQTYGFDGIDLDWEYPGFSDHNGTPQDKTNFNLLLAELRSAIDAYGTSVGKTMLLTAAVGAVDVRMQDVDWPVVSTYLDIINLMSYDYFGSWDPIANHNSPLQAPSQGDAQFNLAWSVDRLVNYYGVSPDKITAGLAFYGRSAKTNGTPSLFAPINGQVDNVTFSDDAGTPLYYNVLSQINLFTENWDSQAKGPYLTGNNGLNTFVSYDNEQSIQLKSEFIVENNLRGAIIWEITGDYIETTPGSGVIANTPLVNTVNDVFCNYIPSSPSASLHEEHENNFIVYPNPTSGEIIIPKSDFTTATLLNSLGQKVYKTSLTGTPQVITLPRTLSSGTYYLELSNTSIVTVLKVTLNCK